MDKRKSEVLKSIDKVHQITVPFSWYLLALSSHKIKRSPATQVLEAGAYQKCEDRLQRLDRLNAGFSFFFSPCVCVHAQYCCITCMHAALDRFQDTSWAQSDGTDVLILKLKFNPYFPAIQKHIISPCRQHWYELDCEENCFFAKRWQGPYKLGTVRNKPLLSLSMCIVTIDPHASLDFLSGWK